MKFFFNYALLIPNSLCLGYLKMIDMEMYLSFSPSEESIAYF